MKAILPAAAALLTVLMAPTAAQTARQTVARWTDTPPVMDGKLDDTGWRQAPEDGGFVKVSDPRQRPEAPTFVKILMDGEALYVGFRCVEPRLDRMRVTPKNHDDPVWIDDSLEVVLDPDNLKRKLYHLIINSAGVQYDAEGKITLPETSNDDPKWDGKWESVCSRGNGEWYAEYRLPFATFGISPTNGGCVGLNLGRGRVGAHREDSSWASTRIEYVNPACLGELYLPNPRGEVLKVELPKSLEVVCGTAEVDVTLVNTGATPLKLHWKATLDGVAEGSEQSEPLTVAPSRSLKARIPLSLPKVGDGSLKLIVQDDLTGRTLYNGFRSLKVLPEIEIAEALYALGYQRAEAKVTVHLPSKVFKGASLEVGLLRRGDEAPLATKTERLGAGASLVAAFDLAGHGAGNYFLRVQLRKGAQVLAAADSQSLPFTPNPAVGFDPHGFLTVEGKPWFPVGLYTVQARAGGHDEVMEEARQAGFNTTVFYAYTVETIMPLLDAAQRHGLRAFVYPANPYHVREHTATREELVGEIQARMRHPALLGWYLVDEPEGIGVSSVQTVRDYYQLVKETDPAHPCSLVIMSPGAAAKYGNSADIVWIDPYPIPYSPVTFVSESMEGARTNVARDKPIWTIPQAFDWSVWKTGSLDKVHRPTPEEERCMTYLALVHGAKGIIYWAHTASKYYIRDYPEHWAALKAIAGELRELSPVLLTPDSALPAKAAPRTATLDLLVKQWNGQTYVIAVNREPTDFAAKVHLGGVKPTSTIEVLFENRTLIPAGNGWTDQFAPFAVHVYRLKLEGGRRGM
jgi:hypothetical protein